MNIRTIIAATAMFGCGSLLAQENRFSAGIELGVPMGDMGDATSFGFGASLGYEIPVGDNLGAIAQVGYMMFMGKDYDIGLGTVEGADWAMIPAQVGAKYYFTDNQEGAYAFGLVGIHHSSYTVNGVSYTLLGVTYTTPDQTFSDTNFSFAPGLGYIVGENIDLGLRYQIISGNGGSSSYLGLRAAYMFGSR